MECLVLRYNIYFLFCLVLVNTGILGHRLLIKNNFNFIIFCTFQIDSGNT